MSNRIVAPRMLRKHLGCKLTESSDHADDDILNDEVRSISDHQTDRMLAKCQFVQ